MSDYEQLDEDCNKWFELCHIKDKIIRNERRKVETLTTVIKRAIKDHDERMLTAGWHDLECTRFKKAIRQIGENNE